MERVYAMDGSWVEVPGPEDLSKFMVAADIAGDPESTFLERFEIGLTGEITLLPEHINEGWVSIDSQGRAHPGDRLKARAKAQRELEEKINRAVVQSAVADQHKLKVLSYARKLKEFREWAIVCIPDVPKDWHWAWFDAWDSKNIYTILMVDPEAPIPDVPLMLRPTGQDDLFEALLPRHIGNLPVQPLELIRDLDLEIVDYWDGEQWVEVPGNSRDIIVPRSLPT